MEDALLDRVRTEAARAGKSASSFIADIVENAHCKATPAERNPQLEALELFLAGPMLDVSENGKMPTAEERNRRR